MVGILLNLYNVVVATLTKESCSLLFFTASDRMDTSLHALLQETQKACDERTGAVANVAECAGSTEMHSY